VEGEVTGSVQPEELERVAVVRVVHLQHTRLFLGAQPITTLHRGSPVADTRTLPLFGGSS